MINQTIFLEANSIGQSLVMPLGEHDILIQYQMDLLIRHRPTFLLPCILRFHAGQTQVCLDVTGLKTLDVVFKQDELNQTNGRQLLISLLDILIESGDRLLPVGQFSLQPESIYMTPDHQLVLAFWPVEKVLDTESNHSESLSEFHDFLFTFGSAFKIPAVEIKQYQKELQIHGLSDVREILLINSTPPKDDQETSKIRFVSLKNHPGILVLMHTVCIVLILMTKWPISVKTALAIIIMILLVLDLWKIFYPGSPAADNKQGHFLENRFCSINGYFQKLIEKLKNPLSFWINQLFHESKQLTQDNWINIADTSNQTILLSTNPSDFRMALLTEGKPGTAEENEGIRAYVLIDEFIVGRDHKTCDLNLTDPGIGRQHARIIRREGSFFICDLGSRNGTCLNGRKILKNVENLLPDQCLIKFADHQFYFAVDG